MSDEQHMTNDGRVSLSFCRTDDSRIATPPNRIWALVPTKELVQAKSRLASLLNPFQRRTLVLGMLRDVFGTLLSAPELAGVAVIGRDPLVRELCSDMGVLLLQDTGTNLNASLKQGTAQLAHHGADGLLVVPGDVPLITPGDVAILTRMLRDGAAMALAPARDSGGTNGLGLRLPSPVTFQFGTDSFALHLAQARRLDLPSEVYRSPTLGLDIDTPDDLRALEESTGAPMTHSVLRELCWQLCAA